MGIVELISDEHMGKPVDNQSAIEKNLVNLEKLIDVKK